MGTLDVPKHCKYLLVSNYERILMSAFEDKPMSGQGTEFYGELCASLEALLAPEADLVAVLANASALINHALADVNWVGFYILRQQTLVVGPFQGKPACTRIPLGKGVCGTVALKRETLVVSDVHDFPGHIACDASSRSEIVLPLLLQDGSLFGVLDIDSPTTGRFSLEDAKGLERVRGVLERKLQALGLH